jgi:MFS family permease
VGGCLSFIAEDIGGTNASIIGWLPTANTLAIAAVAPFVGYLDDLIGKRYITLGGALSLIVGCILVGTAQGFGQAIVGMGFAGAGAAIGELTGLAGYVNASITSPRLRSIAKILRSQIERDCSGQVPWLCHRCTDSIRVSIHALCSIQ